MAGHQGRVHLNGVQKVVSSNLTAPTIFPLRSLLGFSGEARLAKSNPFLGPGANQVPSIADLALPPPGDRRIHCEPYAITAASAAASVLRRHRRFHSSQRCGAVPQPRHAALQPNGTTRQVA